MIFAALATSVGESLSDSPVAQGPRLSGLTHDRRGATSRARIAPAGRSLSFAASWFRGRGAGSRYVVSVDEHGEMTMIPAEPRRN